MAKRTVLVLLLSVLVSSRGACKCTKNLDADVLILGAGMTGVAAAKTLHDAGVKNFLILEARNETGGRMRSKDFAGVTVELGALWIQGVDRTGTKNKTHPIWALKQRCGLEGVFTSTSIVQPGPLLVYDESGNNITTDPSMRYDAVHKAFADNIENIMRQQAYGKTDVSLRVGLTSRGWIPMTPADNFLDWASFDFDQGNAPEYLSLFKSIDEYKAYFELGNGNFFVTDKRGYSHLVRCLAEDFNEPNKIRLNTQIKTIEYDSECVCATSVDGQRFCGKYGIVTFSIGVLQGNDVKFSPELPKAKKDAIKFIKNGLFLKIFLHFNETFWSNDSQVSLIGRATSRRGYYCLFQPAGKYYPSKPNLLVAFLTGQTAVQVTEQDLDVTKQQILAALRTMYPNYSAELLDIYIPDWESNPLYRGSYSSFLVGLTDEKLDIIAAPVDRLYIAGEGISKNYNGYVHGAYFMGVDTAKKIIKSVEDGDNNR